MKGRFAISIFFFGTLLKLNHVCLAKEKRQDAELRLVRRLMKNYHQEKQILPAQNRSNPVVVTFDMAFSQLVDLDSKDQIMTSNIWVRQFWTNNRLAWDPAEFSGIKIINVSPKIVWKPDILLYNNINGVGGEMYNFDTKVILHHDGRNEWFAPTEIKSICKIDITFFPFDEQTCLLTFGSWTYNSQYLDLALKSNTADLKKYTRNGQWTLVSVNATKNVVKYSCCKDPFVDITFTVHIRRRPLFYVQNLILPCILLATLTVFSFSLPPGSGERIALVITLLLGLTVYMLIFTENIPQTSEVVPLISKFFIVILFEVSFCLMGTSITLRFYHYSEPERKIPSWVEVLILGCLAKLLGMSKRSNSSESRDNSSMTRSKAQMRSELCQRLLWCRGSDTKSLNDSRVQGQQCEKDLLDERLEEMTDKISDINGRVMDKNDDVGIKEKWHFAASVIDRLFFYLSGLAICLSVIIFYLMIPRYEGKENVQVIGQ
ncbi:hypothetical protein ACROYT_G001732 [Oculina patagonica]